LTGFTESAEATHNPYVVRNVHQVNSLASEGTPPYFGGLPPLGAAEVKVVGLTEPMHIDHS
jgi:hypothetical protein